jgi:hypothetical protein
MPRLALLTAYGGPIELAEFPLSDEVNSLQHNGFPSDRPTPGWSLGGH